MQWSREFFCFKLIISFEVHNNFNLSDFVNALYNIYTSNYLMQKQQYNNNFYKYTRTVTLKNEIISP